MASTQTTTAPGQPPRQKSKPHRRSRRHPRRQRLRFTREGKIFTALTLAIGFAAINTGNNLLYLILGTLLTLIIGSGILSDLALRGLSITRTPPKRIFAKTPFLMGISLKNAKRHLPSFTIEVDDLFSPEPFHRRCFFLKVPSGRTQNTAYRHTFDARGQHHLLGFIVGTRFPFGLFEKTRPVELPRDILVFPEVRRLDQAPARFGEDGATRSPRIGRIGDFHALRDYRDGDDPRDIAWRNSARLGRPLVRERELPRGQDITIYLDTQGVELPTPALVDRQEEAVRHAAAFAAHYLARGLRVSLITRAATVSLDGGDAHLDRILTALALVDFPETSAPAPALPPHTICVHVEAPAPEHPETATVERPQTATAKDKLSPTTTEVV